MLLRGKFTPRPGSKLEQNLLVYAPPQLFLLALIGLMVPGVLLEYALFRGHAAIGIAGLVLWVPLLCLLLIKLHNLGRVRLWLSASVLLVVHVLIALGLAGSLPV
jgi:hypothetical protein